MGKPPRPPPRWGSRVGAEDGSAAGGEAAWGKRMKQGAPSVSDTNERREKNVELGLGRCLYVAVNASVVWSNPCHAGQNRLFHAQVLQVNGFDSYGTNIRQFCSWGLKLDEHDS